MKSIIFGNNPVSLVDSLYITVVSMAIVFLILVLIAYSLSLLKYVNKFDKKEETKKNLKEEVKKEIKSSEENNTKPVYEAQKINLDDEDTRVAIMVATIEMAETIGHNNIKVRRVERIS